MLNSYLAFSVISWRIHSVTLNICWWRNAKDFLDRKEEKSMPELENFDIKSKPCLVAEHHVYTNSIVMSH